MICEVCVYSPRELCIVKMLLSRYPAVPASARACQIARDSSALNPQRQRSQSTRPPTTITIGQNNRDRSLLFDWNPNAQQPPLTPVQPPSAHINPTLRTPSYTRSYKSPHPSNPTSRQRRLTPKTPPAKDASHPEQPTTNNLIYLPVCTLKKAAPAVFKASLKNTIRGW